MRRYDVTINGIKTTLKLSDADAAARGLTPADEPTPEAAKVPTKAAKAPANKSRKPANKRAEVAQSAFTAKAGEN